VPRLPPFELEVFFACWEFRARHNLAASDAETMRLADLLALAEPDDRDAWDGLALGYRETTGWPPLRAAIAGSYDVVAPDDVLCFAGAQEGIACAVAAVMAPGDHAVIVTPSYASAESIALSIGTATGVPLDPRRGWALDVDAVEAAIRPSTSLISLNFPNNPTGAICDRRSFEDVLALADAHGIVVLSDEVYRGIERDPALRLPAAADRSASAISLGVLSKAYGLPGLRIGWIASRDRALLRRIERQKHYGSICNAGPSEVLARIALRAGDRILAANRERVGANVATFDAFFARHADRFEWLGPQGGCVAYPRYLGADGADDFCTRLLDRTGVLLLPPRVFATELAPPQPDRFRIGVGRGDPGPALAAFDAFLSG
jgi:aspartate/methionine/tyrosine aminotransferase